MAVIQKTGEYENSEEAVSKVLRLDTDNDIAIGFDSDGDPDCWSIETGVAYFGYDLVAPKTESEWTPTNHYKQITNVNGFEWTSRWQGKPPLTRRTEQKWTRGTEEEWRPVVTDGV